MATAKAWEEAVKAELDALDPRDETNPTRAVLERILEAGK